MGGGGEKRLARGGSGRRGGSSQMGKVRVGRVGRCGGVAAGKKCEEKESKPRS